MQILLAIAVLVILVLGFCLWVQGMNLRVAETDVMRLSAEVEQLQASLASERRQNARLRDNIAARDRREATALVEEAAARKQSGKLQAQVRDYACRHRPEPKKPPVTEPPRATETYHPAATCGLDAPGLGLWNAANSGTAAANPAATGAAGGLPNRVPTSAGRPHHDAAAESHRDDGCGARMPDPTQAPASLDTGSSWDGGSSSDSGSSSCGD